MKTITVCNQKGGAGKTTTAIALAAGLSRRGFTVLALDLDPQHNLTSVFCPAMIRTSVLDVFRGKPAADAIQRTAAGFDILPGTIDLSVIPSDYTLSGLKPIISQVQPHYNYCIIDTPPALSLLTMSAMAVSDEVVIPALADMLSLYGLDQIAQTVEAVKPYNQKLKIAGILLTMYQPRRNADRTMHDVMDNKAKEMGTRLFSQTVREGVSVQESYILRQDLFTSAPRAAVTGDYDAFITELLKGAE